MDQWGVGRRGFDDGLVILFDLKPNDTCHGQVQLYAGPGYRAKFLSNADRQSIYENEMLPLLARATSTARCWWRWQEVDNAATPEHAASLNFFRLLNAVLGLLVAPLGFVLIVGAALLAGTGTATTRCTSTTRRSTCRHPRPASPRRPARSSATASRPGAR